jgi:hypothetical protein
VWVMYCRKVFLCASVVRSEHHDFTTETQRHREIMAQVHPYKTARNRFSISHRLDIQAYMS